MAFRVLHYIMLFYRDLERQNRLKQKKFPFVLPIVLYNGDALWNAPENMSELIEVPVESLRKYTINFKYNLISVNNMSSDELLKLENAISTLFYMEKSDINTLKSAYELIVKRILLLSNNELREDLSRWLLFYLDKQELLKNVDITKLNESEVVTMLATSIKKHEEELIEKGIEKGIKKGREEGREEGRIAEKKEIIFRAISKKFSDVPTDFESKIKAIDNLVLLDTIIDTILDAKDFCEIYNLL